MDTLEEYSSFIEEARIVLLTLEETVIKLHSIERNAKKVSKDFEIFTSNFKALNMNFEKSIDKNINFTDLNKSIKELSIVDQQLKTFKKNHQQLKLNIFKSWLAVTFGAITGFIVGFLFNLLNLTGV